MATYSEDIANLREYVKTKSLNPEAEILYNELFASYSEVLLLVGTPISEVIEMFESDILNPEYEAELEMVLHNVRLDKIRRKI